jgi:hypothetical protein
VKISVARCVDDDRLSFAKARQDPGNAIRTAISNVFERKRRHPRGGDSARRFLLDPFQKVQLAKPERGVEGELGFRHRNETFALPEVMDVIDGVASALKERGTDQDSVDSAKFAGDGVGLSRKMSAQSGIAPARDCELEACLLRGRKQVTR